MKRITYILFCTFALYCAIPLPDASQAATNQLDNLPAASVRDLVAPIALYPDPLLGIILPASVFPDQIVDAVLLIKTQADAELIAGQKWDQSVKAVATYPGVLKMMYEKIDWTTKLGTAFVNQGDDVRDAIQALRTGAQENGNLQSTPEQTVSTKQVDRQNIIIIEPAKPEVVYVPQYSSSAIYTEPVSPSYNYLAPIATFGLGMALGAAMNNDDDDHYHYGGYPGGVVWYNNGSYNDWVDHRQDMIRDAQNFRQDRITDRNNYRQDMREDRQNFRQDQIESGNYRNREDAQKFRQDQAAKRSDYANNAKQSAQDRRNSFDSRRDSITPDTGRSQQAQQRAQQRSQQYSQQWKGTAADRGYSSGSSSDRGFAKSSNSSWSSPRSSQSGARQSAYSGYGSRANASSYSSRGSYSRGSSGFSRSSGGGRRR